MLMYAGNLKMETATKTEKKTDLRSVPMTEADG
jgi:hypothetical protein